MSRRNVRSRLRLLRGRRGLLRQQRKAGQREPAAFEARVSAILPASSELQVLDVGQGRADGAVLPQDKEGQCRLQPDLLRVRK